MTRKRMYELPGTPVLYNKQRKTVLKDAAVEVVKLKRQGGSIMR